MWGGGKSVLQEFMENMKNEDEKLQPCACAM